ncbi:hypothetical protein [Endozoicomonas sp. 4G]|uniref:hypothetical protein n=1 Tax=Endozoicomonas sp. 4G TaxID=2872754 RepID=UPI002078F7CE|nr:hypothetical protein [Endozoicomonas sp. 4G]
MLLTKRKFYLKTVFLLFFACFSNINASSAKLLDVEKMKKELAEKGVHIEASVFESISTTDTITESVNGKVRRFQQIKSSSNIGKIMSTVNKPKSLASHNFYANAGLLTIGSRIKSGSNEIKVSFFDPNTGQSLTLTLFNQPYYFQITQARVTNQKKNTNSIIPVNKGTNSVDGKIHLHWSVNGPNKRFTVYIGKTMLSQFNTPNFPVKEVFIDNGRETITAELTGVPNQNREPLKVTSQVIPMRTISFATNQR